MQEMAKQEIHDFYVQRSDRLKKGKERVHTVMADVDDEGELNRNPVPYWKKGPNDSIVRIPRICFVGDIADRKIADFFGAKCKLLTGEHIFIRDDGLMDCLQTCLEATGNYSVTASKRISCVYPCYENNNDSRSGKMLLGLKFDRTNVESTGQRTFGRQMDNQSGSGGVFDVTDSYLSEKEPFSYAMETFNANLPEREVLFAIYLCRGARLVVKDERYYYNPKIKVQPKNKNLCNSLLQMGSLVVVEGTLKLQMAFEAIARKEGEVQGVRFTVDWTKAAEGPNALFDKAIFNRDLEPSERMETIYQLENSKKLNQQKRFVIFLGPHESELDSSVWQLSVTTKPRAKSLKSGVECCLLAPQNGRILDIQPWESGFQHVIWRHRYERLFESVLSPVRTPEFEFKVPPAEILSRILGSDAWPGPLEIKVPPVCKVPKELAEDVFLPLFPDKFEAINLEEIEEDTPSCPPAPPPLYPPVWDELQQKLFYLQYGSHPTYDPNRRVYVVNDQDFQLCKKNDKYFKWDFWQAVRPDTSNWRDFDQCSHRLANDYRIYKKSDQELGTADVWYFKSL